MPTPIENLTQNVNASTQQTVLQAVADDATARQQAVDKASAINAIVDNADQQAVQNFFGGIAGDSAAEDLLTGDNALIDKVSEDLDAIEELNASESAIRKMLCRREGFDPANFADFDAVAADQGLMQAIAARQESSKILARNQEASAAAAASQTAMQEVRASQPAMQEVAASQTAMTEIDQVDFAVRAIMCGTTSQDPTSFADPDAVSQDATAMSEIAGNATTMSAIAVSQTAMQEVADSQTAMQEVAASQAAMQEVAASETAMDPVSASQTAMQEVAASSTAMDAVAASTLARSAVLGSSVAADAVYSSELASKRIWEEGNTFFRPGLAGDAEVNFVQDFDATARNLEIHVESLDNTNGEDGWSLVLDFSNYSQLKVQTEFEYISNLGRAHRFPLRVKVDGDTLLSKQDHTFTARTIDVSTYNGEQELKLVSQVVDSINDEWKHKFAELQFE